jgi:preprotein translocase subunit YajC
MNLTLALVTAVAAAPTGDGLRAFLAGPQGQLLFYGAIMVAFLYFMILRPQQARAKEQAAKLSSIKRGDQVVLSSGVVGKVVRIEEAELGLEIAPNVSVKVIKSMIADVRPKGDPASAGDAKS